MGEVRLPTETDPVVLIQGDCLDVLPTLPSGCVDAVVTDPPYNVGISYASHNDKMPPDEYENWCRRWFAECRRITRRHVVIFPGHGNLGMWHRIQKPSGVGCWYKPGNPASGGVFQFCEWEPWLVYGQRIGLSDVIRATVTEQKGVGDHPCPKPLPLFVELIRRLKPASVADPFAGTFTTGVACVQLGCQFLGIEKEPSYVGIGRSRVNRTLGVGGLYDARPAAVDLW